MYTYAQLALDKLPGEAQFNNLRLLLERIIEQGDQTIEMLEELLEATRVASNRIVLDRADVKLVDLLQQIISEKWPDESPATTPVQLSVASEAAELVVEVDAPRLKQAFETLINFLTEANQAAANGNNAVVVKVEMRPDAKQIEVRFSTSNLTLTSNQELQLFDFYRPVQVLAGSGEAVQPKGSRMGVALYTAQGVLRRQGGDLIYEAGLPGFKVTLPAL
jgi:K+-sensing histidine kinase KdpD